LNVHVFCEIENGELHLITQHPGIKFVGELSASVLSEVKFKLGSSPFSISQNTCTFNRNSASEGVTHYVPKCITSVSQSDILCGDRVENFSSDCWLQNHLDQFGHNVQPHPAIPEEIEADYDDDSPIVSTPSTEANSISSFEIDNSFEDEMVNRLYYAYSNLTDIAFGD
jgi:hypothetical protein